MRRERTVKDKYNVDEIILTGTRWISIGETGPLSPWAIQYHVLLLGKWCTGSANVYRARCTARQITVKRNGLYRIGTFSGPQLLQYAEFERWKTVIKAFRRKWTLTKENVKEWNKFKQKKNIE